MSPGQSFPEKGIFFITYVRNTGAAFGLLANQHLIIIIAILVAISAIIFYYTHPPFQTRWFSASLGLLLGGAIGNLIDRFRFGYVVDFLDIRVWPVFNVADSAITVGVSILVYLLLFKGIKRENLQTKG